jgi:hypothetical protein
LIDWLTYQLSNKSRKERRESLINLLLGEQRHLLWFGLV